MDSLDLFFKHLKLHPECKRPGEPMRGAFFGNTCRRCGQDMREKEESRTTENTINTKLLSASTTLRETSDLLFKVKAYGMVDDLRPLITKLDEMATWTIRHPGWTTQEPS